MQLHTRPSWHFGETPMIFCQEGHYIPKEVQFQALKVSPGEDLSLIEAWRHIWTQVLINLNCHSQSCVSTCVPMVFYWHPHPDVKGCCPHQSMLWPATMHTTELPRGRGPSWCWNCSLKTSSLCCIHPGPRPTHPSLPPVHPRMASAQFPPNLCQTLHHLFVVRVAHKLLTDRCTLASLAIHATHLPPRSGTKSSFALAPPLPCSPSRPNSCNRRFHLTGVALLQSSLISRSVTPSRCAHMERPSAVFHASVFRSVNGKPQILCFESRSGFTLVLYNCFQVVSFGFSW